MPIYAYKCASCGHAKDVLQKISDPVLTQCPACSCATFSKQLTAAGFQLKGSGWYATDFKGNSGAASPAPASETPSAGAGAGAGAGAEAGSTAAKSDNSAVPPAAACGGSCACH